MNNFIDILNDDFQKMLQSMNDSKYHLFFDSHKWFINATNEWKNQKVYKNYEYINEMPSTKSVKLVEKCDYTPTKVITDKELEKIYSIIESDAVDDFNIIRQNLDKMHDYLLPSTISNVKEHIDQMDKKDINIIIAGAGPIGLFTALYLNALNSEYYFLNRKRLNVLVIDNRIYEETIKLPYSRLTQFGIDISQIQMFIKKIFCWKNKNIYGTRQFDFINIFENLLYVTAYHNNIPMLFTKKI
jgi:hypothetical protein